MKKIILMLAAMAALAIGSLPARGDSFTNYVPGGAAATLVAVTMDTNGNIIPPLFFTNRISHAWGKILGTNGEFDVFNQYGSELRRETNSLTYLDANGQGFSFTNGNLFVNGASLAGSGQTAGQVNALIATALSTFQFPNALSTNPAVAVSFTNLANIFWGTLHGQADTTVNATGTGTAVTTSELTSTNVQAYRDSTNMLAIEQAARFYSTNPVIHFNGFAAGTNNGDYFLIASNFYGNLNRIYYYMDGSGTWRLANEAGGILVSLGGPSPIGGTFSAGLVTGSGVTDYYTNAATSPFLLAQIAATTSTSIQAALASGLNLTNSANYFNGVFAGTASQAAQLADTTGIIATNIFLSAKDGLYTNFSATAFAFGGGDANYYFTNINGLWCFKASIQGYSTNFTGGIVGQYISSATTASWVLVLGYSTLNLTNVMNANIAASGVVTNYNGNTNNYGLPLKADANGAISGTATYEGRTVNEWNLPNFWQRLNSTNAVRILCMGDSTMTWPAGSLSYGLMAYFKQIIPVPILNYITVNDYALSSTVGVAPGTDTNWFCAYAMMPPSSGLTNSADAQFLLPADVFRFAGIAWPHGGNVQVEAHTFGSGTVTVVATISLSNSAGFFGLYTNIPVSGNVYPVVRSLTADTGSSNYVLFCVQELSKSHSLVVYNLSNSGQQVMGWRNINTNIFNPILKGLDAAVIVFNQKNSQGSYLATNIAPFDALFKYACTNTDIAWTTTHPAVDNVNWDITGINKIEYTNALAQGDFFFDSYDQLPSTNVMQNLGLYLDAVHLSTLGGTVVGGMLAREMMHATAGIDWTASGGLPYLNVSGNASIGGTGSFGGQITIGNDASSVNMYSLGQSTQDNNIAKFATRTGTYGEWFQGYVDSSSGTLAPSFVLWPLTAGGGGFALPGNAYAFRVETNGNGFIFNNFSVGGQLTVTGTTILGYDASSINSYSLGNPVGDNNFSRGGTRSGTYGEWNVGYEDSSSGTIAPAFALQPLTSGGGGFALPSAAYAFRVETNGNSFTFGISQSAGFSTPSGSGLSFAQTIITNTAGPHGVINTYSGGLLIGVTSF